MQVRTFTYLILCMGNAGQWDRAVEVLYKMQLPEWGAVQVGVGGVRWGSIPSCTSFYLIL